MARSLRLEFPGALYHVTSRGNASAAIFNSERDRWVWLRLLEVTCLRFNFKIFAYCQMTNHFHLMIETPDGNLGQGMRHFNSRYSQYLNKRCARNGHVFQGRYKAILVQKESYLLELSRYIVLNPVRAGIVQHAAQWPWSSYHATTGPADAPAWLDAAWLLLQFHSNRAAAQIAYQVFVGEGVNLASPLAETRFQIILGDDAFVERHGGNLNSRDLSTYSRPQRRLAALTLAGYSKRYPERNHAMGLAYRSTNFSMVEIARFFGVSTKTVERAVKKLDSESNFVHLQCNAPGLTTLLPEK